MLNQKSFENLFFSFFIIIYVIVLFYDFFFVFVEGQENSLYNINNWFELKYKLTSVYPVDYIDYLSIFPNVIDHYTDFGMADHLTFHCHFHLNH